ncbi:RXT2-like protein [Durotheca rogersii]|uniref:RXT2-like protein n=1 Tax=Durotheca rogersii TaxID=419775 RepID=UPI00221EE0D6|nr:RXT2-like protein [Durotheca rogersii]KAI5866213.1 RXT2-like protein [Durotheca rogersii]
MSATQHILFAETIAAMKKALKRKAYDSDSDSEINYNGNRGHKLKKRARFVHEGQLAPPSGPEVYKEVVNHAGHHRAIISRNPVLVDDEGFEVESGDEEEYIRDVTDAAAEFNPYANVRLENILAPLTSITDLPRHPTLSRSYTSKTLTELARQGLHTMHKENAALWRVKHLQTMLVGDHIWVPCEMMLGPNDIELYRDDYVDYQSQSQGSVKSDANVGTVKNALANKGNSLEAVAKTEGPMSIDGNATTNGERADSVDTPMVDAELPVSMVVAVPEPATQSGNASSRGQRRDNGQNDISDKPEKGGRMETAENARSATGIADDEIAGSTTVVGGPSGLAMHNLAHPRRQEEADNKVVQHSQAGQGLEHGGSQAVSVTSEFADDSPIHPLFLPPRSSHPDRDLGIPEAEAEDMRRLLQLYVQKQEEVCRGAKRLYEGLLRADRMRKAVLQWSKYEAHVGANRDLSDGEDWYDKEEWGLEEDLKKGQDEEEEDMAQPAKKTRTRR